MAATRYNVQRDDGRWLSYDADGIRQWYYEKENAQDFTEKEVRVQLRILLSQLIEPEVFPQLKAKSKKQ